MSLLQLLLLALVQGLTEFLPVSSSAHLILLSRLLGWPDQGLVLDVAAHLGTLLAVLWHFREKLPEMLQPARQNPQGRPSLFWLLLLASLPLAAVGYLSAHWVETYLRSEAVIAWSTIIFALLLGLADRLPEARARLNTPRALLIGLAQCLALIPGTSRSGVTITAGLLLGLGRVEAVRFAMLTAIPATAMAGGYGLLQMLQQGHAVAWAEFFLVTALSAFTGWLGLRFILHWAEQASLRWFVYYRLLLGVALLLLL